MSETHWQGLRIGDAERESALRSLGDHMAAGRLTVDEFGDRSAQVAAAKTRGDLVAVFTDLPEPRPRLAPVAPPAPAPVPQPPAPRASSPVGPVVVVVLVVVGVFASRYFPPFLLMPLVAVLILLNRKRRWP